MIKDKSNNDLIENSQLDQFEFFHTNESIKSNDEPVNALKKIKKIEYEIGY